MSSRMRKMSKASTDELLSDAHDTVDPYFQDYNVVKFTGGPLNGQTRRMDVYVGLIPIEFSVSGRIKRYYQNINAVAGIDSQLRQKGFVHYVYFENGRRI